jgi:phytoene dehydrogenase-like protein
MNKYDFVIIGAGHNGLIVACYLAKAGFNVCVVEGSDKIGGGVRTEELTVPGFKHDWASMMHGIISYNPLIYNDELGLKSKYGLKYIYPEKVFASVFPDGSTLVIQKNLDKTCENIASFSQHDADAYRAFHKYVGEMLTLASMGMFAPPPKWGAMNALLDASPQGREYMRILLSSAQDVVEEWFETEQVRTTMSRFATEMMIGPEEKGTGSAMFFVASLHRSGYPLPQGGSGRLVEALAACLKDLGGTIRTSSRVTSIKVTGNEVKSIVLFSGEELEAEKGVISSAHPKDLFLSLLKPENVSPDIIQKVKRIKPGTFSAINQVFALKEAPQFKFGEKAADAFFLEINPIEQEYLTIFDGFKRGKYSIKIPLMLTPSLFDPSRAPAGSHVFGIYHYEPYHLEGGAARWDEIKQTVADEILDYASTFYTNLNNSNILGRWIATPLDIERINPSMKDGDIGHIGQFMTQMYSNRPITGYGQYKTPIQKLYLCGAGTHPGTGVSGGGRATAQVVLEDYGINLKKLVK